MRLGSCASKSQLDKTPTADTKSVRIAIAGESKQNIFPNQKHGMQNNNMDFSSLATLSTFIKIPHPCCAEGATALVTPGQTLMQKEVVILDNRCKLLLFQ